MKTVPAPVGARGSDRLLDRILGSEDLARVVPQLPPELLHRVIQRCGLEDCGQLVALATPGQLACVFDLDLWRAPAPGLDERFDANRFGTWLEVLVEAGVSNAAATLAGMDVDLIIAGLAAHIRVYDYSAVAPYVTLDGELSAPGRAFDADLRCEVGGYLVCARRSESWDAVTAVLGALADAHGGCFNQLMRGCCRLSDSRPEIDGLDDLLTAGEQTMFDLGIDREARRSTQGYTTPAEARAFLQVSRQVDRRRSAMPARDPMTHAYFRSVDAQTVERDDAPPRVSPRAGAESLQDAPVEAVDALVDLLHEAGVTKGPVRALLESSPTAAPRLARIQAHLQFAHDCDPDAYMMRSAELAYLANVVVAGSTIQSRPLEAEEASRAAVAVCNLGLENWPRHWLAAGGHQAPSPTGAVTLPEDFLIRHDLITVFQVGWTVLHEDVCMYAADRLLSLLMSLRCADGHVQDELDTLRVALMKHWRAGVPWQAREALEVIAILDTPSWAALLGLIDHFPTLHAAVGASLAGASHHIDACAFEFISENSQVQTVRAFLHRLPGILRG